MPELPDVEAFKNYFRKTSLNKTIEDIKFGDKSNRVLEVSRISLERETKSRKFKSVERHGKHLFVTISGSDKVLEMHFGMTGFLSDSETGHPRVVFEFSRGKLVYDCQRLLGKVELVDSKEDYLRKKGIGKDALDFSEKEFVDMMRDKKGNVKSALMSQEVIAGIGNIYADEILFQSRIHPKTSVKLLKERDLKKVYRKMIDVFGKANKVKGDIEKLPKTWIIPVRHVENSSCPRKNCNGQIRSVKVGSRTSFYCPRCQR